MKKQQEEAARRKAEDEKMAKLRAENCQQAKTALATLKTGVRLSTVDAKGERSIMDDKARAAEEKRLNEAKIYATAAPINSPLPSLLQPDQWRKHSGHGDNESRACLHLTRMETPPLLQWVLKTFTGHITGGTSNDFGHIAELVQPTPLHRPPSRPHCVGAAQSPSGFSNGASRPPPNRPVSRLHVSLLAFMMLGSVIFNCRDGRKLYN